MSVTAGHYHRGQAGQRFFARLRQAGVVPGDAARGHEDDAAFAAGVGFTDIIKRATANATGLPASEYAHGREQLLAKLETHRPQLVIFMFKKTAQVLFGSFGGNGFVPGNIGRSSATTQQSRDHDVDAETGHQCDISAYSGGSERALTSSAQGA